MINYLKQILNFKRNDSVSNFNTNLGLRTNSTSLSNRDVLTHFELEETYNNVGIGARIVDVIVEDALRNFIEADVEILQFLKKLNFKQKLIKAGCLGRLYGGSLMYVVLDDNKTSDMPVDTRYIKNIVDFHIYALKNISVEKNDYGTDITDKFYNKPLFYTITSSDGSKIKLHADRCFAFSGDRIATSYSDKHFNVFSQSVLTRVYKSLKNYLISQSVSTEILHDFVQIVLKIDNLSQKMSSDETVDGLQTRLNHFNATRSVSKICLFDKEEDYEKISSNVAGIADLISKLTLDLSASSGIPVTRLFGDSPSGLNSTGKGDLQCYYDTVRHYRSDQLEPAIDWCLNFVFAQEEFKNKKINKSWEFASLTSPTELEQAQIRKIYAEIDMMYIDRGALDASEVAQERFYNGKFHELPKVRKYVEEKYETDIENLDLEIDKSALEEKIEKEQDLQTKKLVKDIYYKIKK